MCRVWLCCVHYLSHSASLVVDIGWRNFGVLTEGHLAPREDALTAL